MATSAGAVAQRSNPELLLPYSAFIASDGIANIAHCQINKRRLCLRNHGETTQSRDVPQRRGGESCLGLTVHWFSSGQVFARSYPCWKSQVRFLAHFLSCLGRAEAKLTANCKSVQKSDRNSISPSIDQLPDLPDDWSLQDQSSNLQSPLSSLVRPCHHLVFFSPWNQEAAVHWQQAYQEDEANDKRAFNFCYSKTNCMTLKQSVQFIYPPSFGLQLWYCKNDCSSWKAKLGSNHLQTATSSAALAACFDARSSGHLRASWSIFVEIFRVLCSFAWLFATCTTHSVFRILDVQKKQKPFTAKRWRPWQHAYFRCLVSSSLWLAGFQIHLNWGKELWSQQLGSRCLRAGLGSMSSCARHDVHVGPWLCFNPCA